MVLLKPMERKNPQDVAAPPKFYAQAISQGITDLQRLAYLVSNQCTVREADCLAVLNALQHNVMDELAMGRVVQLGTLGNFQIGVRSEGTDVQEDLNVAAVRSAHVNFRPGPRFRTFLKTVRYRMTGS
ncbi:DNA-binding protein [Aequorivita aquimaris]|uniref:DNA-binding protein n=1 Tax=Aequorivita aquimaris TaxID=1548749 RepID=A0A137RLA1_9FLAO|nr:HU family DNA-binding protein [Aequorivita aquimaris]KXO00970.1 DNA-binding protein [Aequorivita aquimaris]